MAEARWACGLRKALLAGLSALLAACSQVPLTPDAAKAPEAPGGAGVSASAREAPPGLAPARVLQTVMLGGQALEAEWHLPPAGATPARGLLTLQHGFSRRCDHLRTTAQAFAQAGLVTLCVNASVAGGGATLARTLGEALAAGELRPPGVPMPERIVVSGFSAGAHFAVALGAQLVERVPQRVAGAVLLDPVGGRGFETALQQLSAAGERPVLSLAARSDGCNARHVSHPALLRAAAASAAAGRGDFAGVVFGPRSTHMDAEGEDTDWLAFLACGRMWPEPSIVAALRELAVAWSLDLLEGRRSGPAWPGGERLQALVSSGIARPLGPVPAPVPAPTLPAATRAPSP